LYLTAFLLDIGREFIKVLIVTPIVTPAGTRVICDAKGVKEVRLVLESGQVCHLNVQRELKLPNDPEQVWEAAEEALARYTFWSYQTERALRKVSQLQDQLEDVRGVAHLDCRVRLQREAMTNDAFDPKQFGVVAAMVSTIPEVNRVSKELREARFVYGVLRGITKAHASRLFLLDARARKNQNKE